MEKIINRNNWISTLITLMTFIVVSSCAREDSIPVTADFDIKVVNEDYSVPVRVEIKNKSKGADTYQWTFEGAVTSHSSQATPKPVIYTKAGIYKIILKASNKDGNEDRKELEIKIDAVMKVDFDWMMQGSDISPVTLQMQNKSLGATNYHWEFEEGLPARSNQQNPKVVFNKAGEHSIKLTITNGRESYTMQKSIIVKPEMTADFDWSVDYIDNDYQAPVILHLKNKSTHAFSYKWIVEGASPSISEEENPDIHFANAGNYTIILQAINDKATKEIRKQITIHPDVNLLSFSNIKLGINTAHNTIGCFFSSNLGKVIKENEVSEISTDKIDFGFFGLNTSFTYNQFLSPDEVQTTSFNKIPNAIHTKIINSQELVKIQLNPTLFESIKTGKGFSSINITETNTGKTPFDSTKKPRVVLFQTNDGRKGAILVKDYISSGRDSYILVDIKVQKHAQ